MNGKGFTKESKERFIRNLHQSFQSFDRGIKEGLLEAGIEIRAQGMRITPVGDTGNLKNSWYGPNLVTDHAGLTIYEIGLTADYAPWVHEMTHAKFRSPGASAKFLEKPLMIMYRELLSYIKTSMSNNLRKGGG